MESVLQDLRFTVRQLWKNKSFTLTAILSLALGSLLTNDDKFLSSLGTGARHTPVIAVNRRLPPCICPQH